MLRHTARRSLITALMCLALILPGVPSHGKAQGSSSPSGWQMVGQYGGPVQGIAAQGRYVYVGVGPRLVVLDALDPASMHAVGATAQFDDFVKGVAISGTLANVAAGSAGLRVVNVSDPAHPTEIGAWDSPGYAEGVAMDGQTAYLADGPYGLATVDVTNPAQPTAQGSAYAMNFAFGVAVSGQYAYVAAGDAGLLIANVTNPAHPAETGAVDTPGYAYEVAASDTYAYVADGWNGLQIVNVADPGHPALSGLLSTPGWAFGVTLAGTRAHVADAAGGLRIVDVTNPAAPLELGAYEPGPGQVGSVAIAGNIAFIADRSKGVRAVDVSDLAHPASVGLYSPLGDAIRLVVAGNYAYIAAGDYGLRIVDVTDATHPIEVGWYDTQGYAIGVQLSGTYAYVATSFGQPDCGIHVVNISNPANPTLTAFYPDPSSDGAYRDIAVAGGIAYLPDETGLQLVSVADPLHPTHLSRIVLMEEAGQEAVGVTISGTVAYVASSFAGLKTVDVSNPLTPTLLGQSTTEWSFSQDVVVVGNIAYMADYNILRTIDVSDPAHPVGLGLVFTPSAAYELAVAGSTAYVAGSGQGLTTVDVSNPADPVLTGGFDTVGYTRGVDVAGGYVYLADGPAGLAILAPTAGGMFPSESHDSLTEMSSPDWSSAHFVPGVARRPSGFPYGSRLAPEDLTPEADERAGTPGSTPGAMVCTVTSAADSGAGTLRACLQAAGSGATIDFSSAAFPPANPVTITLLTELPHLTGNVTLDASNAGVILDGSSLGEGDWGLALTSDGNVVRGLQLTGFSTAILVMGRNNVIGGDRAQGAGPVGQGNLISGNRNFGIFIAGTEASDNLVVGNLIGTDVTGTQAWGNANIGVFLYGGPHDNTIGGTQAWQRNIVSDNYYAGIGMMEIGTNHNQVVGNYVGTDISGTIDLGNRGHGITMELAASANLIQGNLSSGNDRAGVCISDQGSNYNIVIGNRLGTDAGGTQPIPNDWVGVFAGFSGASFNRIGGTAPGEGNLISGNDIGVSVTGSNALGNLVLGNLIGTDSSGLNGLGNVQEGLNISAGETVAEGNVITANGMRGVFLGSGSTSSFLLGNIIGTDRSGAIALGNDGPGIEISASGINFVQANTVAFNLSHGVQVNEAQRNTLRRNSVYSNDGDGIVLTGTGNAQLAAPALASDPVTGISGTACVSCTVEIFADAGDEGRYYLATQVTDGTGGFAFGQLCPPAGLGFTATTTDRIGNTSEFSAPQDVLWTCSYIYLPLLLRRSP
jgi:parallel beta-helix repeat protein